MNESNHTTLPEFAVNAAGNPVEMLRHFIDGSAEIWIKYTYYLKVDRNELFEEKTCWIVDGYPGSVVLRSFPGNQRFYSNLKMIECAPDRLTVARSGGRRIIRIRDIIFIDSQLYVKTGNRVLKMKDDNGFLAIRIPDVEYKSIIRQLKRKK